MKRKLSCIAACMALLITAGCSNTVDQRVVSEAKEISTAETSSEQPQTQEAPSSNTKSVTLSIDGHDLVFPTSREDAEKFLNENGYEIKNDDRVIISGYNATCDGYVTFQYMDTDPSACTGIGVQRIPVVLGDILNEEKDTYEEVYDTCNAQDSDYICIYQQTGNPEKSLGLKQKNADNCYLIKFTADRTFFNAFSNRDAYDNYGSVTYTFDNFEGYYLSSTDIDGLYVYSQPEGRFSSFTHYFYREGLNFKMDKALVCTLDTRTPELDPTRESFDNIYVGKDSSGNITEIYSAGVSSETYASANAEYEAYCKDNNVSVEPKELLEELIPSLWHKDLIETLGALLATNPALIGKKATFRINKESVQMDYDNEKTIEKFKVTIDEYPDAMILASVSFEYEDSFVASITGANIVPGQQQWLTHGNDSLIIMDEPTEITNDFDDFFSTSGNYEDLPTTYSVHDYVGCFVSGIPGSTNMLIEDASGNPVAVYLGEHDYSAYHKVPIIQYGDEKNYPGTEMLDGLDFSAGVDADGNYVYVE